MVEFSSVKPAQILNSSGKVLIISTEPDINTFKNIRAVADQKVTHFRFH